ncbi:hypothetical protein [Falsiroseomonas tokyonensis]|uniref:Uncharacterized protein n=1 Tax=Falsiroseomonas tokyonensis TaxID=430521 RepID=A0ABV7BRY7_9PROT|nr:hypothetical protein [Falsiroseomonas tokyonensis]MBU8538394.1 hypothetical protein [Falsiroseomonas tokyonensis]
MQLRHRRAHRAAWIFLTLLLPLLLAAAFALRGGPEVEAPRRLAPPGAAG